MSGLRRFVTLVALAVPLSMGVTGEAQPRRKPRPAPQKTPQPPQPSPEPSPPPAEPPTPPTEAADAVAPITPEQQAAAERDFRDAVRAQAAMRANVDDVHAHDAQIEDELQKKKAEDARGFIVLPAISFSPELGLSLGAFGMYFWHFGDPDTSRTTSVRAVAIYTTKAQAFFEGGPDVWLEENAAHFNLYGGYSKAPYSFFGIGNSTHEGDEERFTERRGHVTVQAQPRLATNLYVGAKYRFDARDIVDREKTLATGAIPGSPGVNTSGGGPVVTYDTRDRIYAPLGGSFFELSYSYHPRFLASDLEFGRAEIDLRQFFPVFGDHVLGFQVLGTVGHGTTPFYSLAQIGGNGLRGIYSGRYRENHMLEGQVEYRYPIFWRIGGAAFIGAGAVAHSFDDFPKGKVHPGYGMGIRYAIAPAEGLNVRLDVGYGDTSQLYIDIGEAF